MKIEFEKVMSGISRYMDAEIYANMNEWQEFLARLAVGRLLGNEENLKDMLVKNGYIRTFNIIDADGMVDVESLADDLRREIGRKGKVSFELPMFGKMTFTPADVDVLYHKIIDEV